MITLTERIIVCIFLTQIQHLYTPLKNQQKSGPWKFVAIKDFL